jgi:hypothetical protein
MSGGEISALAVAPDSRFIATGGVQATVGVWEIATGQLVASTTCQHEVLALSFAPLDPSQGSMSARRRVLHIADAGGACHIPRFYTMELVGLL